MNRRFSTDKLFEETKLFDIRQLFSSKMFLNADMGKTPMLPITQDYQIRYREDRLILQKFLIITTPTPRHKSHKTYSILKN